MLTAEPKSEDSTNENTSYKRF